MNSYIQVIDYIVRNAKERQNAIIGSTIGNRFGISSVKVRAYVNEARQNGYPICSCGNGYYYSTKKKDIDDTIRHLKGRVAKVELAIDGLNGVAGA